MIEELRTQLYKAIELNGNLDLNTIEISQELDKYIVEEMKKQL